MDAIIEAAKPIDGTQDAESAREAIADALSALLEKFPDADLLALTADQRELVIESFVAADVCRRFDLDVGKTIFEKAPNVATALSRSKEVYSYVREVVALAFRELRDAGTVITGATVVAVVRQGLDSTFLVFEGWLT